MKAKGIFISTLLVIDTFFVSYAAGFHSRHVLVINPKLPPVVHKKADSAVTPTAAPAKKTSEKSTHQAKDAHTAKNAPAKSTAKPTAKHVAKPDSKPPVKPVSKPAAKPTSKPKAKPAAKPATMADEKPGA